MASVGTDDEAGALQPGCDLGRGATWRAGQKEVAVRWHQLPAARFEGGPEPSALADDRLHPFGQPSWSANARHAAAIPNAVMFCGMRTDSTRRITSSGPTRYPTRAPANP